MSAKKTATNWAREKVSERFEIHELQRRWETLLTIKSKWSDQVSLPLKSVKSFKIFTFSKFVRTGSGFLQNIDTQYFGLGRITEQFSLYPNAQSVQFRLVGRRYRKLVFINKDHSSDIISVPDNTNFSGMRFVTRKIYSKEKKAQDRSLRNTTCNMNNRTTSIT